MTDAGAKPDTPTRVLSEVTRSVLGRAIELDNATLLEVLSPEHFVRVRAAPGEPAPAETGRAIALSRGRLASDDGWLKDAAGKLRTAEDGLTAAVAALGR